MKDHKVQQLNQQLSELDADPASDPVAKITILNELVWALFKIDLPRTDELGKRLLLLLESYPEPNVEARCKTALAEVFYVQGDYAQALQLANAVIASCEQLNLDELRPYVWATLGAIQWRLGNFAEALAHFQQHYRTAQQVQNRELEVEALSNMALVYSFSGDIPLALETYAQALRIAETLPKRSGQALILNNVAMNLSRAGDYTAALDAALQALHFSQEDDTQSFKLFILDTVGLVYAQLGEYDKALTYFRQGQTLAINLHAKRDHFFALMRMGWLFSLQRKYDEALALLLQALEGFQQIEDKLQITESHKLLSELYEQQEDWAQALHHHKQLYQVKEAYLNEKSNEQVRGLQISHDVERLKHEAEIHQLRNVELQAALDEVKRLSGLLPICSHCHKIRDDTGYWHDVAVYIRDHSEADFSHGICPECINTFYPQVAEKHKMKQQQNVSS